MSQRNQPKTKFVFVTLIGASLQYQYQQAARLLLTFGKYTCEWSDML